MTATASENTTTRTLVTGALRAVDSAARTATFVAATQNGVDTWSGTEHLVMAGADFKRYRKNPVVLDTHNRWEAGATIGKAAELKVVDGTLLVVVAFAQTERANTIFELVAGRFLNAVSVGFIPRDVQVIADGESYDLAGTLVTGPARIVKKWELFEISIVPVPADADALRRSFFEGDDTTLLAYVRNLAAVIESRVNGESPMSKTATEPETRTQSNPDPTPAQTPRPDPTVAPALTPRATIASDARALCPRGLEAECDRLLLEHPDDFEEVRRGLLAAHTQRCAAVGHSDPELIPARQAPPAQTQPAAPTLSDAEMVRGLHG